MTYFFSSILVIFGTLISVSSSSSPLTAWVGLELNSLSFIPLMKNKNNLSSHESMIKYFLVQSISSILFLTSSLLSFHVTFYIYPLNSILLIAMSFTLLTKLATVPFHFWLFPLINSISWFPFILLMTWQKIAPLFILSHFPSNLMIISIILSTIIPPVMMMNQNSLKMILTYASITHMAWLLTTISMAIPYSYFYLITYMINFIPIFYFLSYWNIFYLSQTIFIPNKHKFLLFFIILSLSGFPPLMMFMMKIILLFQFLPNYLLYKISLFLLLSSLMMTYIYSYINFPFLMKNSYLTLKNSGHKNLFFYIFISIPLFFIPMMFILIN